MATPIKRGVAGGDEKDAGVTPKRMGTKEKMDAEEDDLVDRTPRKRSLRQLLAKQKTPLRGRLGKTPKSVSELVRSGS